ncbi:MAG: aldo/keto reductase [Flavobacteriales bacterium]|nr:aldo/keto reductase [Flavobacteriales bacterium]
MSECILGTVQFGLDYGINNTHGKPGEGEVFDILEHAFRNGVRLLDTAHSYGSAEEVIGRYHAPGREPFSIISKFVRNGSDASQVRTGFLEGLERMSVDHYHTYHFHRFEELAQSDDLMSMFSTLKEEGKMTYLGVSVYDDYQFEQAINHSHVDVIQIPFNLLDNRKSKRDLLTKCQKAKKQLHARSVFLQGLFFMDADKLPAKLLPMRQALLRLRAIASEANLTMEELALGYVMTNDEIQGVLIGVDNVDQLKHNLAAASIRLPDEVMDAVHQIRVEEPSLLSPVNWT